MSHAVKSTGYTTPTVYPLAGGYKMAFLAGQAANLTSNEFKLLFALVDQLRKDGCYPNHDTLMAKLGWTEGQLRYHRGKLAAKGVIGFISGSGQRSTRYIIHGLEAARIAAAKGDVRNDTQGAAQNSTQGAAQNSTDPNTPALKEQRPPDPPPAPAEVPAAPVSTDPLKKLTVEMVYRFPEEGRHLRDRWLSGVIWIGEDNGFGVLRCATEFQRDGLEIRKNLLDVTARALGFEGVRILGPVTRPNLRPIT